MWAEEFGLIPEHEVLGAIGSGGIMNDVRVSTVKEELRCGNDIEYLPVTTPVCFYDRKTMRFIEDEKNKLEEHLVPLRQIGKVLEYA